jgi:hypothetical protein
MFSVKISCYQGRLTGLEDVGKTIEERILQFSLDSYGVLTPPVERPLAGVGDIPVDVEPVFPLVAKMQGWQ